MVKPRVLQSHLPIQVIYNSEVDRIRAMEQDNESAPAPIHFTIQPGNSGLPTERVFRIESESVAEPIVFEIDLDPSKTSSFIET